MKTKIKTFTVAITLICTFAHLHIRTFAQVANGTGAGNCLSYDGVNDYISVVDNGTLYPGNNSFTVEAWFKYDHVYNALWYVPGIIACRPIHGGRNDKGWSLNVFTHPGGPVDIGVQFGDGGNRAVAEAYNVSLVNSYNHLAGVRDKGTGMVSLFLNGVLLSIVADVTGNINGFSTPLKMGYNSDTNNYWQGSIDEIRVWNLARTETEIRDNMCKKLTGSESGLVGYWRFDEGSGSTVYDATTNGNNGTLY